MIRTARRTDQRARRGGVRAWARAGAAAVFVAALGAGVLASAGASAGAAPTSNANTFVYDTYTTVITTWDPSTEYSNEVIAFQDMYETLTRYDTKTKKLTPLLATSWSSATAGKVWTFHLRHGVVFHTGKPMTATSVKDSIERTMKINGGAAYIWAPVSSIDTPNTYTVVFHLSYAAPLDLVSSSDYGAYIFTTQAAGSATLGKWFAQGHTAGTGPYEVDHYQAGAEVELTLSKFSKYWGGWHGHHFSQVVYRVTPQATTAAQLMESQQVSYVEQLTPRLWKSLNGDTGLRETSTPSWQNLFALFNTSYGPMSNLDFRKAVADAIDYKGILAALQGAGVRTPGVVPDGIIGYDAKLPQYNYNLTQAKKFLAKSPYAGKHVTLTLTYTQGDTDEQLASSLMKSELSSLGINLTVESLAWPTQWAKAQSSTVADRQDILLMYWWPTYADPYSWFVNLFETQAKPEYNLDYYSNKTMDAQIAKVEQVLAVTRAKGAAMYDTMQRELYATVPGLAMWTQTYHRVLLSSIKGFTTNPAYPNVVFVYELTP